jgi:phage tail-like protein
MAQDMAALYPFHAFNFAIEIDRPGGGGPLCEASFAECDGLEMTMEVKTIREGGNNGRQIRLAGPLSFGQLTLKRGMTASFDLWDWFTSVSDDPSVRVDAHVILFAPDRATERARFRLERCLPIKLKAPPLNAKDGLVAVEELQIAYERFVREPPQGGAGGAGPGAGPGTGT